MKTILLTALLCLANLVSPSAHAQQTDTLLKQFLDYKAKAEQGDAEAQFKLGASYTLRNGVAKNEVEAVKWYRRAAEQNLAPAQTSLGVSYYPHCALSGNERT